MVFNAKLVQATLITKTDFDATLLSLNKKITSNKTKYLLLETEFKKLKNLIQTISLAKVILKKMVRKIICYFSRCTDILTRLMALVVAVIFILENLKDRPMKILQLLPQVITNSIQN